MSWLSCQNGCKGINGCKGAVQPLSQGAASVPQGRPGRGTLVMAVLSSLMKGTQGITLLRSLGKLSLLSSLIRAIQGQWTSQDCIETKEIFFAFFFLFFEFL